MKNTGFLIYGVKWDVKWQPVAVSVLLTATVALPFFVHLIPNTGSSPIGAVLLPIFYAPLVAALLYRVHVGLLAAVAGPVLNHLITGMPAPEILLILTLELILFTGIVYRLRNVSYAGWISGPLAYLSAKLFSMLMLFIMPAILPGQDPFSFFTYSISNAIPGLFVLLIIGVAFRKWRVHYA